MNRILYPFDGKLLRKNRKKLRRELLADGSVRIKRRIAVLGGSTCDDIVLMLELFLLDSGIEPEFYISDYNKFYEDAVFGSEKLDSFSPDIVFIHTTSRNLTMLPDRTDESPEQINERLEAQFDLFKQVWTSIAQKFACPIIQNNFELPLCRQSGNYDGWGYYGKSAFISRLNVMMSDYARKINGFYINDISYLSACIGLEKWHDAEAWYLYKYAMSLDVIPDLAYSAACIIKSICGRNKKVLDLDLDNTLWGGVIGDDGQEGIEIGHETAVGQSFTEFQSFVKEYKNYGVLLAVCSKNDEENALLGLNHPDCILKPDDFASIKANWDSKDRNIESAAEELNLLTESFVFIDDNPAECEIIKAQLPETAVINLTSVQEAMYRLSRSGYFEITSLSADDLKRSEMYAANAKRAAVRKRYSDYSEYLLSLEMRAEISDFTPLALGRITQLTNKSNQFNLTTRRYTEKEMEKIAESDTHIRLCGRLSDKFGDNGIVSVVIGRCEGDTLHIELWLMSCRILKRGMELAMLDSLAEKCRERGIKRIIGYYFKTAKNNMVSELFGSFGFRLDEKSDNGDSVWSLDLDGYKNKNKSIEVRTGEKNEQK
ncbi:MAG: HAD-IIIC family phosphatase [Oscillospiraceae bacterium]|nr:HAD-IIIC family phosphatase [Oscillospiraceae bacterium]